MFKFPVLHNEFLRHLKTCYITWITDAFADYKYVLPHETHLRSLWGDDFISFVLGISKVVKKVSTSYLEQLPLFVE